MGFLVAQATDGEKWLTRSAFPLSHQRPRLKHGASKRFLKSRDYTGTSDATNFRSMDCTKIALQKLEYLYTDGEMDSHSYRHPKPRDGESHRTGGP